MSRLIDADFVIDTVNEFKGKNRKTDLGIKLVEEIVSIAPTVDAEPIRHGFWKDVQNYYDDIYYECSACGEPWILLDGTPSDNNMNYCPNCGALMDKEEEDE